MTRRLTGHDWGTDWGTGLILRFYSRSTRGYTGSPVPRGGTRSQIEIDPLGSLRPPGVVGLHQCSRSRIFHDYINRICESPDTLFGECVGCGVLLPPTGRVRATWDPVVRAIHGVGTWIEINELNPHEMAVCAGAARTRTLSTPALRQPHSRVLYRCRCRGGGRS